MKTDEKKWARQLRSGGLSLKEIVAKTGFSKGSVSVWIRDVELTMAQKRKLSDKGYGREIIERRRKTRLENENKRRQIIIDGAKQEINNLSTNDLQFIGIALYWGEGSKTLRSGVQFSNSDPRAIEIMMSFFKKCCEVPEDKFRGHVFLHPTLDIKKAERYWQNISGIPVNQFYKTSIQQSRASKNKKNNLPFGTFCIQICNTKLFLRIKGWIEKLYELEIKADGSRRKQLIDRCESNMINCVTLPG